MGRAEMFGRGLGMGIRSWPRVTLVCLCTIAILDLNLALAIFGSNFFSGSKKIRRPEKFSAYSVYFVRDHWTIGGHFDTRGHQASR